MTGTFDDFASRTFVKVAIRMQKSLDIDVKAFEMIVGLPESEFERYLQDVPPKAPSEVANRTRLFATTLANLSRIVGEKNDDTLRSWLYSENTTLHGKPIDLMQTQDGLTEVSEYVADRLDRH
jgi:hypothetical protein